MLAGPKLKCSSPVGVLSSRPKWTSLSPLANGRADFTQDRDELGDRGQERTRGDDPTELFGHDSDLDKGEADAT